MAPPTSLVDNELENRSATDMSTPIPSLEWELGSRTGLRHCNRSVNIVAVDSERLQRKEGGRGGGGREEGEGREG